jgi:hypothetical protein
VNAAAAALGISASIVAAQINEESGFNPNAVSPAGAEGIAQFMPGTFAEVGYGSPFNVGDAFNAYTAYMGQLLHQEGGSIQKALEAYNAGPGNLGAGAGYASTILSNAGQPVTTTSSTDNAGGGGTTTPASIDPATLAEQYGFTEAFLNANPELKTIFNEAVTGQWSNDKFQATLMTTNWWKTHDAAERKFITLAATDPAEANQQMAAANVKAQQLLASTGVNVPAAQMKSILSTLSYNIAAKGWSDQQAQYFAGQYVTLTGGRMSGDAETQYNNALQYAYSMGVTASNPWYQNMIRGIEQGTSTFTDVQAALKQLAVSKYSQFAQQINGGQTVQDLASPYIQQMGTILELNPSSISAFDPTIQKALTATGTPGAPGQPLWSFENDLRSDPRWMQTNNARDSLYTVAHQVLQDFGKAF